MKNIRKTNHSTFRVRVERNGVIHSRNFPTLTEAIAHRDQLMATPANNGPCSLRRKLVTASKSYPRTGIGLRIRYGKPAYTALYRSQTKSAAMEFLAATQRKSDARRAEQAANAFRDDYERCCKLGIEFNAEAWKNWRAAWPAAQQAGRSVG